MTILGLIPARGGSKGIPQKNLYPLLGKPLIGYTIETANSSVLLSKQVVSTDDEAIAECARGFGAEVPFMRPRELSEDQSSAFDVVRHAVNYYSDMGIELELIVYLQPTSPLRTVDSIDTAVQLMLENKADSLVSVIDVPHQFNIESQMIEENGYVRPAKGKMGQLRRQDKTHYVARNGPAILITRPSTLAKHSSLYGEKILSFKMDRQESHDVDDMEDIEYIEYLLSKK